MNRAELTKAVSDLIAEATESGVPADVAQAAVADAADLPVMSDVQHEDREPLDMSNRPDRPQLALYNEHDRLKEAVAEKFAELIEEFFSVQIRTEASNEAERPHFAVRLALGVVEAARRCVQQAAFECGATMPVDEIDDAAIGLFLIVDELGDD